MWSVGATLAQTVFDGGARGAAVDQAIAAYNATVAGYRQTVLTAFQQVEDGLAAARILGVEIQEQQRNVALAQRAFDLERVRYETGVDPYINLMQEQTILLGARATLVTLQVQHSTAVVMLVEALGGGWDRVELPTADQLTKRPPPSARHTWK